MTSAGANYSHAEIVEALRRVGLEAGDTVFVHASLDMLGQAADASTEERAHELLFASLWEVLGPEGTLLVPTYTFSFCKQENFDVENTPTAGGPWSASPGFLEYVRKLPGAVRSRDPIHSVAGVGPKAAELLADLPATCFGEGSIHDRLLQIGGKICTIGVGINEATFRHHVEEKVGVPFRYKKLFTGYIREGGVEQKAGWVYNVRILADNGFPDGHRLEAKARADGLCRVAPVGSGEISAITCRDLYDLTEGELARDPWFTARGPAGDPVLLEEERVGRTAYDVALPPGASIEEMIDTLWTLPRQIVSDAYDAALEALAAQVPMTVHEYPAGLECWSWIIPEKWTCREACLETIDGKKLFSSANHPLHVVSYSLPFDGVVTREELFDHLYTDPKLPEAVPFKFKYYERDWGLCCSQKQKDALTGDTYRVKIDTEFSYSTLKVGEVVVPGASDECIVLCAHLCHPGMVNDDLTGVAVGIDVVRELLKKRDLRYTYRLLIVPETIGSIAYLSQNEDLIPKMKGGLFLEMLGRGHPHAMQMSFSGDTEVDRCFSMAMAELDPESWTGGFRTIIGNDERQFNGPGVRVPMLSLSRVLPASSPDWPYIGYHSDFDNRERTSIKALEDSRDMVLHMIDVLESNLVPVNNFKGEVFCSRYGIFIDWSTNPEGSRAFFDIMSLIDGTTSIVEIARACSISFTAAKKSIDELRRHGLVTYV